MRLEIGNIIINDIQFGEATHINKNTLYINKEAVKEIVLEDERIKSVSVELAKPGDKTRITPVKDVIEPRVKVQGNGRLFPGILGKVDTVVKDVPMF